MDNITIAGLIELLKTEDCTNYLAFIEKINTEKLSTYNIVKELEKIHSKLTITQLNLLKQMSFYGGYNLYAANNSVLIDRWKQLPYRTCFISKSDLKPVAKEDLKYLSSYMRNKWKKFNSSNRSITRRGSTVTVSMDEFSLTVFKNNITKPFLRTEAKTLVEKVNTAYEASKPYTDATVSIRNRFYKLILDNTKIHTKVLLNNMYHTRLIKNVLNGAINYYIPRADETISVNLSYNRAHLISPHCFETYSTDTGNVSGGNGYTTEREINRQIGLAVIFTALAKETSNDVYLNLAKTTISSIAVDQSIFDRFENINTLHQLLKETHE